jgi:HlyD family secretion protein
MAVTVSRTIAGEARRTTRSCRHHPAAANISSGRLEREREKRCDPGKRVASSVAMSLSTGVTTSESKSEGERAVRPAFRPPKKRPVGKLLLLFLVLVAIGAAVARRMQPKAIVASPVVRGVAVEAVYATGTVEALDRVTVKAKVTGSIVELKVREGDKVKKGDLLARIDSPTLKFDLAKGQADLWAASKQAQKNGPQVEALDAQANATKASLKIAREDRDRVAKLVASGTSTQVDLDKASTQVATLEAQLASQEAQKKALQIDLGARASGAGASVDALAAKLLDTELRSPIDGIVLSRSVDPGETVMINQAIVRVGDVTTLVLECSIDEADIGKVKIEQSAAVSLYAFPGKTFKGTVFEILPDADRAKKSFLTRVRVLDAPVGMRSGMTAEVNVVVAERPGSLLAPTEAIDEAGYAWVVKDGRAEKRKLEIGVRDMLRVEVLSGVSEGEHVAVTGIAELTPGARVHETVKPQDLAAPPKQTSQKQGI